jgi:hypothetical protein
MSKGLSAKVTLVRVKICELGMSTVKSLKEGPLAPAGPQ